jgi:hypothetical protein
MFHSAPPWCARCVADGYTSVPFADDVELSMRTG